MANTWVAKRLQTTAAESRQCGGRDPGLRVTSAGSTNSVKHPTKRPHRASHTHQRESLRFQTHRTESLVFVFFYYTFFHLDAAIGALLPPHGQQEVVYWVLISRLGKLFRNTKQCDKNNEVIVLFSINNIFLLMFFSPLYIYFFSFEPKSSYIRFYLSLLHSLFTLLTIRTCTLSFVFNVYLRFIVIFCLFVFNSKGGI